MTVDIRGKLRRGETAIGTWFSLTDPVAMEVLSQSPFDFLLVDGEHAPIGEAALPDLLRAAQGNHTAVIYRVRENSEALIKMALDLGVDGVFVPRVNSADDARQAIEAAKYPPVGNRGVGPLRASNYYQDLVQYVATANDATTLILQIEHIEAVQALDQILAVPGFDALYVGPADLSASMGLYPDRRHPEVIAKVVEIVEKCRAAGIVVGSDTIDEEHIRQMSALGMQIITMGMDISYLREGAARQAGRIRRAL